MATSMVEWWRKQGLEQGREQSRAEGQRVVIQLLKERFGSLSSEARRRISKIESTEELTRLAARVYQVHSLEELGLA